jgi:hypothetical protein
MPNMHLIRNTEMWASLTSIGFKDAIGQMEYEWIQRSGAAIWFPISNEETLLNPRHYLF